MRKMRLSEGNVIKVCEKLQKGLNTRQISESTGIKTVVINRIRRRVTFQYISNNYVWGYDGKR